MVRPRYFYIFGLALLPIIFYSSSVAAFPPYKTTDADTADPQTLEFRIGMVQAEHSGGETEYVSPLLRTNIGLANKMEIISEFEYLPDQHELGAGALGFKWIPSFGDVSYGVETLALLPVRPGDSGIGIESQMLISWRKPDYRIHLNAGGFHDPRGLHDENGWRASVLAELTSSEYRPGIELFTKQKTGEAADVRLGAGFITKVNGLEIRSGIHFGLTSDAPDIVFNFWFSWALPLERR